MDSNKYTYADNSFLTNALLQKKDEWIQSTQIPYQHKGDLIRETPLQALFQGLFSV